MNNKFSLIIVWMVNILLLSNQPATESSAQSGETSDVLLDTPVATPGILSLYPLPYHRARRHPQDKSA
jgi:hypothetical protein